jgi:hypothetical protein
MALLPDARGTTCAARKLNALTWNSKVAHRRFAICRFLKALLDGYAQRATRANSVDNGPESKRTSG